MEEVDSALGPVASRLTYAFKRLNLELHALHEPLLAPYEISAGQLAILMLVDAGEPESQQEIAQRLGVDRTSMVALIDALEEQRLVARRPDARDRRRNVVELTAVGTKTLRAAEKASDEAEHQLLAALSPKEAAQLRELLARVVDASAGPTRSK